MVVAGSQHEHVDGLLTPMRVQLELYAMKLAMPLLTEESRNDWQAILRRMELACEQQDPQQILDHDVSFHQRLLIVAGLEEMIPMWQSIYCRMRDHHCQVNTSLEDLRCVYLFHKRLLESLFSGDLEKATADWQSHLENGKFNEQVLLAFRRRQGKTIKKD